MKKIKEEGEAISHDKNTYQVEESRKYRTGFRMASYPILIFI